MLFTVARPVAFAGTEFVDVPPPQPGRRLFAPMHVVCHVCMTDMLNSWQLDVDHGYQYVGKQAALHDTVLLTMKCGW